MRRQPNLFGIVLALWIALVAVGLRPMAASAQSTTTGDIAGIVNDPSGAAIPGATVTLKNNGTGTTQSTASNGTGHYRFALLPPGSYTVTVAATGFAPNSAHVNVAVGQVETADVAMKVGPATTTVTVTAEAAPIQTDNGNVSTTFSPEQVALVPNPGNDLTATVQAAPGATMNTQSGYGNFSTFGLPATSNLFTIDGQDDNDPFFNLNNSGATNLLLGQNDVQEVTVTNNGYSGQFGELGGSNVNYVSKSGTNDWHGNAIYFWNGRTMNANNFFNNATGTPRAFDNANQWAWSVGGPIVRNKTFFFVDQEGLDVVIPTHTEVLLPSPAFQTATLANLTASGKGSEAPFYTSLFGLYNAAPGAATATAVPVAAGESGGGCTTFTALPAGTPCADEFQSNATNNTHEWDLSARFDQVVSASDRMFVRFETDQGLQASFTDPISPAFNITSNQPQYMGSANWIHTFSSSAVNELIVSAMHYNAVFGTGASARAAVFPATLNFAGGAFTTLGGEDDIFPQGRNVAQYGAVDDYSWTKGSSTYKIGANFRRNYVNDYDFGIETNPFVDATLSDFYAGNATAYEQAFPTSLNQPVQLYTLGAYAEDDVRVTHNLHLNLTLRAEHDSNPLCAHDCVSRSIAPFSGLTLDPTVPYDSIIDSGLTQTFPSYAHILWQPRIGFAYALGPKTVLRGGFGIFNDIFPGVVVDSFAENPPLDNTFVVSGPLAPAAAGSVFTTAAASNAAFVSGFASGGTLASISAADPAFAPPNLFTGDWAIRAPRYQEWNLELQQALGTHSAFSINYVGNHGIHEPIQDEGVNAYAPGFTGLPATAPDPAFGTVTQLYTSGTSNYDGLVASLTRRFGNGFQGQFNYTWSHALDDVSNGGFLPFNFSTNTSITGVQDPYNIFGYNYGNSDYDVRHYFSLNYLWQVPFRNVLHWGPDQAYRGWVLSGTLFARSGLPLTVIDGNATAALQATNNGLQDAIFASYTGDPQNGTCTVTKQCILPAFFAPSTATPTGFGDQLRNQFRGPRFFDTDFSVMKNTQLPGAEKAQLGVGFQFFNLLNHPNFDEPVGDIASPQFGTIINTASVPTSILGSFLGGDASPRIIQFTARVTF